VFGRFQHFYTSVKVATDVVVLALAFGLAYATVFWALGRPAPPLENSLVSLIMVLTIFPLTFRQARLYATNRSRTHIGEVFEIFKATITGALIIVALTYFMRERYSRLTYAIFLSYAFLMLSATRLGAREILNEIRRRGYNLKTILLIGTGSLAEHVQETIELHRELGFRVVGILTRNRSEVGGYHKGAPIIGHTQEVEAVLDRYPADQVLIALPIEDQPLVKELMERLALRTVDVKIVPDLYQYITLCGGLEEFGGLPIINLQSAPLDGWNLIAKRVFDMIFASLALLVTSPLLALIALGVKWTGPGPILFRQERMGMDGRTFRMLKFRTMERDAEVEGAKMASKHDPRRTGLGAILRRTSLDELPQLFNVLSGEMSLVGPRPERPVFIEEFKQLVPKYQLRHKVKAGITGWAQINGLRGQTSIQKRIEYDLYYIENWSLLLDVKILLRTALGGFLSKNAY